MLAEVEQNIIDDDYIDQWCIRTRGHFEYSLSYKFVKALLTLIS